MNKPTRSDLPLFAGVTLAGAAITGVAVAGIAASLAVAFRKRLARDAAMDGRVVVITGGSRGLGFALAERFGRAGARLVLASRNSEELTHAKESLLTSGAVPSSNDILLVPADLTDRTQATRLIEHAIAHFGHIDVLINNAGIIEVGPVENQPLEAYTRAMSTNFFAALYTTHAALPHLLRRASKLAASPTDSSIANIASIGGKFAVPHLLPYVASKFALVGFSEGLHAELRHKGIRVTTVCPGLMRTGGEHHAHFTGDLLKEERWFNLGAKTPIFAASVSHAANKIYNAVQAGRAEITITPQAWLAARVNGLAPETTQFVSSLVNEYVLPAPTTSPSLPWADSTGL